MNAKQALKLKQSEPSISELIPYSSLVTDNIVITKKGDLIGTWTLEGVSFATNSQAELERASNAINLSLISLANQPITVQVHRVRRQFYDRLSSGDTDTFAGAFAKKYNDKIASRSLMSTEIYLTLILHDREGKKEALIDKFLGKKHTEEEAREHLNDQIEQFNKIAGIIETAISEYHCLRLGIYEADGQVYSSQLSFYNFLVTGIWSPIAVPQVPLHDAMGNVQVYVGSDILQLQTYQGSRFVQSIEFKDYPNEVFSGILDTLFIPNPMFERNYEFIESQTFRIMQTTDAEQAIDKQFSYLRSTGDRADDQIEALRWALSKIRDGLALGEYSYQLLVFGNTEKECRENTHDATGKITNAGFIPYISTMTVMAAFLACWPSLTMIYRPRQAKITSANFAALAPFHNYLPGKRLNNPWGEAVAIMPQTSEQAFYFNFHSSPRFENSYGKKLAGHTLILGMSGAGKTALVSALITLSMKYNTEQDRMSVVFFDKDHGAEILIRALGGKYLGIEAGEPSGLNPFSLPPTSENIQYLIEFMELLLSLDGNPIHPVDREKISAAVKAVMTMEKPLRRLTTVIQNITEGTTAEEKQNSIRIRLAKWYGDGVYSWVFDNDEDLIDFDGSVAYGIDGTSFLETPAIRTMVAHYLLYRFHNTLDGRRMMLVMDEFWKWLADPVFEKFAKDELKTIRKKNGVVILATQQPGDVIGSAIGSAIIENTPTHILLANSNAKENEYREHLKLTEAEWASFIQLRPAMRLMLIKQDDLGYSAFVHFNLGDFSDEMAVLSSDPENIMVMHQTMQRLRDEYGMTEEESQSPENWLPVLYAFVQQRRSGGFGAVVNDDDESEEQEA